MFRKFLKSLKKTLIFILILGAAFIVVISIVNIRDFFKKGDKVSIIIDSCTVSEPGSLLAITRALYSSELEVIALSSSQCNVHYNTEDKQINLSRKLHETLLELANKPNIPALKGNEKPYNPLVQKKQDLSDAAKFYIQQAKELKKDKKVNIVFLGALSNLASVISHEPSLASKFRVYCVSMKYDFQNNIWNKNETNVRYDLDAVDLLLDTPDLELHILPSNLSDKFEFSKKEINDIMEGKGELWNFINTQWENHYDELPVLSMPAIAIIEAIINPKLVKTTEVNTPPENLRRKIEIFSYINKNMMKSAFLNTIKKEIKNTK